MNRKIVLDTETTGLDYLIKDRIIEIAAVELLDNNKIGKEFHYYINPQIKIDEAGIKIHGITDDFVKDKPLFEDIADDLLDFIGESIIIAHNAEFDRNFLNLELYRLNKKTYIKEKFIDSLNLARNIFKGEKNSLDDLCIKFNIDNTARKDHHGALIDTKLLAQVYMEIIKYLDNNVSIDNINVIDKILQKENKLNKIEKQNFSYREFKLLEEEIKEHNSFLNKINNPLWK